MHRSDPPRVRGVASKGGDGGCARRRRLVPDGATGGRSALFLSVLTSEATAPNPLINLAYLGAALLVAAMPILGVGLTRAHAFNSPTINSNPQTIKSQTARPQSASQE